MTTDPKAVEAYLARLRTVKEYADSEGISVVQAHRRIMDKKVESVKLRARLFVVLPTAPTGSSGAAGA